METSKFERDIQQKLLGREIRPSSSAWERLSSQLDEQQQKNKRGWFFYIGFAASIALLVSLFFFMNKGEEQPMKPNNNLVKEDVTIPKFDPKKAPQIVPVQKDVIVENQKDEKSLKSKEVQPSIRVKKPVVASNKVNKVPQKIVDQINKEQSFKKEETVIAETNPKEESKEPIEVKMTNSTISVDSDALLYAVTHSKEEIRGYYEKYKVSRAEVLKTIEKELKKSKVRVDPKTILAEVERDVDEESFQNNFYQFIKKRVSDVAVAIANRNN